MQINFHRHMEIWWHLNNMDVITTKKCANVKKLKFLCISSTSILGTNLVQYFPRVRKSNNADGEVKTNIGLIRLIYVGEESTRECISTDLP
jgi:hypothetical protein